MSCFKNYHLGIFIGEYIFSCADDIEYKYEKCVFGDNGKYWLNIQTGIYKKVKCHMTFYYPNENILMMDVKHLKHCINEHSKNNLLVSE